MPPTYTVRATVVDARTDAPRATDRLFIDTNVWAWEHYPNSRTTSAGLTVPQPADYSPYLRQMRNVAAVRHRTALQAAELTSLIEHTELDAYVAGVGPLTLKEYRHNVSAEHARVVAEIRRVWGRVEADSDPLPLALDDAVMNAALSRLIADLVDGYDLLLLEAMLAAGVTQLLTDDGDFCTVAGIEVFTANPRVLAAARSQGRLVVR